MFSIPVGIVCLSETLLYVVQIFWTGGYTTQDYLYTRVLEKFYKHIQFCLAWHLLALLLFSVCFVTNKIMSWAEINFRLST